MGFTKSEINKRYYRKHAQQIRDDRKRRYRENIADERQSSLRRYYTRKSKTSAQLIQNSIDTQLKAIKDEPQLDASISSM